MVRIFVNGASGHMGREIIASLESQSDLVLAGTGGRKDDLQLKIISSKADVAVDFTHPSIVFQNIKSILSAGAHAVVGTTGLTEAQRLEIDSLAKSKNLGVLIAPNFSIGAVLMMKFASEAAKYLPNVEIVEYHHDLKADSPSGTALKTAEYISSEVGNLQGPALESEELLETPSRGAKLGNIRIHSIRLPGFLASQEVILGGRGQTLKIRHDSLNRETFIPGVLLAVRKISGFKGLVYGLDHLL